MRIRQARNRAPGTWAGPLALAALVLLAPVTAGYAAPREAVGGPPLHFVEDRGPDVAYSLAGGETSASFARDGVTFALTGGGQAHALRLGFVGARATHPAGEQPTAATVGASGGRAGVPGASHRYGRLVYRGLWPGIDLVYTGDEGHLKYTFVIRPGADPGLIELVYRGATGIRVTSDGRLAVSTPLGSLEEERPYAYQEAGGRRIEVKAAFALVGDGPSNTSFRFQVGSYDASQPLILDPVIKLIGFETRNASEIASLGLGSTVSAATVRPGSGVRSLSQAAAASVLVTGLTPALDTLGLRFSFRKPSNPGADQTLLLFTTGATSQWALQLRTDGRLQVQDLASLTFVGSAFGGTALGNATWYTVRLAYNRAAGGVLQVWLDASLEVGITHTAAGTAVDQIQVLGAAALYNYDDFHLTDTATQPPLGQIVRLAVNGPGYRSDFGTVVAATNREANVDDLTPSDADYNGHAASTTATDFYALQASPAGSINAVKGMWRMSASAPAVGGSHDYAWRIQGIEASQAFTGLGAAWTQMEVVWSTPPSVGGSWTRAEVDGLELGARHNGTHAEDTFVSWAAAMVDYDAGGSGGAAPTCSTAALKPWYNPSWGNRKAILVDHTKVVGDLVDFPVLISTSGDPDLLANARADGFDILFTDEDGTTKLSHQIEAYDGAGNLVAWVKVPLLPTGVDKTIFMYYGYPASPDQQSVLSTWTNGYQAVWHLSEASGAGAYIRNSALANHDGTPAGTVFNASGKIDGARTFSNAVTSRITIANSSALFNLWSQFSLEFWVYPNYASDAIWLAAGEDQVMYGETGPVRLNRVRRSGFEPAGTGTLQVDVQFNTGGTTFVNDQINGLAWNHIVYTYQGSDFQVFFNGTEVSRTVFPDDRLTAAAFLLLGHNQPTGALNGGLDEVRISNAGRSAEWILTEYANQNAPATFCSVCPEQAFATTEVTLLSFTATGSDSAVDLAWQTASELNNLGFNLYRSWSGEGPYERITSSLIPGLGSSPTGASYSYRDTGLLDGQTYHYKLEDVEATGKTGLHGPVSATPMAGSGGGGNGGSASGTRITYGQPEGALLRIVERGASHAVVELLTPGFYAIPNGEGQVQLEVPGFESRSVPGAPAVPVKRAFVEALAGRRVRLSSILPSEEDRFDGLRLSAAEAPDIEVTAEGMVKAGLESRREGPAFHHLFPRELARVLGVGFQGETKKARLELAPLRYDPATGTTFLAKSLRVRLDFEGVEEGESGFFGSKGRRPPPAPIVRRQGRVAELLTPEAGLYGARYEDLFGRSGRGVQSSSLRLSRQGRSVAYHLEPDRELFGPGSVLYFLSEGSVSNPWGEAVYELETRKAALKMAVMSGAPSGPPTMEYLDRKEWEQNRYYQAGLLAAPDLWQWDLLVSPVSKSYPFTLANLSQSSTTSHLTVFLQGASDFEADPDHHVRVYLNGQEVGEATWNGKTEKVIEAEVPAGILREGQNTISLENVGDAAAAYSMVFLNKLALSYPRLLQAENGQIAGRFAQSGRAFVQGLGSGFVLDTAESQPKWLTEVRDPSLGVSFRAEAGRRYLAVSAGAVKSPEIRRPPASSLRSRSNRADWILIGPKEFLPAARPLIDLRMSQGLMVKVVSVEEVYREFGFGEGGPQAIKAFLEYAYEGWRRPSYRYVVLLGDGTYDPKDYLKTGVKDRIPPYLVKTSYLWTASDPAYGSVNGEDLLPDVAIGRLSAGSLEEARILVEKLVAFEGSGRTLQGRAVLIADNADAGGSFDADSDELANGVLSHREIEKIYLRNLGGGTRATIGAAFDSGAGLASYVGHGGTAVWASENIFNNSDLPGLQPQLQQPFLMTMNCLNGFFHFPPLDSLAEAFVKAEGKGAIAAFSPSGLSMNEAAHAYQRALLEELESDRHARLGDAILAAQAVYANSGAMPELLSIYNLFGDPAMKIN